MMTSKTVIGLVLGFLIGIGCSLLKIPVPAPPVLMGSFLVASMTIGYILTDKYINHNRSKQRELKAAEDHHD